MSYDELSPDSKPPHTEEEVASTAAQDTSPLDAPPDSRKRRSRARVSGSDAASASETNSLAKPARAHRIRAKANPATGDAVADAAHGATARGPSETTGNIQESAPAASVRRVRRRAEMPAESVSDSNDDSVETTPALAVPPVRRTRSRRVAEPAQAAVEHTPEVPEVMPEPETSNAASRRRAPRTRTRAKKSVESPELPVISPEEASKALALDSDRPVRDVEGVPSASDTEEIVTGDPGDVPSGSRMRRNRRGGRSRRPLAKSEADEVDSPVEEPAAAAIPQPVVEPEPEIDLSIGAHLVPRYGLPQIQIDGRIFPPVLFFGNLDSVRNRQHVLAEVRRAARAGVHLHSTLIELPCPLPEASNAFDEIDDRLRAILDADPEGFLMPRIVFVPARGWKRDNPNELASYADGETGDPSIASERFWREAEQSLHTLVVHFRRHAWGRRVFGYHLERGEWFQSADQGYDRSNANRDAFRDWLLEKYQQSLIRLRAAWYDADVQFHSAEIPVALGKPNLTRAFFETRRERNYIDFHEFTSESTAARLITLARAVKKASENQALVSVCYGYTFEFGHPASGHLALNKLLNAASIDLICGPPSYRDRKPGGAASLPAPIDSFAIHGKLWLTEDDTKTYLAPAQQDPDDFNPRLGDKFASDAAHQRAIGRALASTTGIGFMDLWGEGWLDDDAMWERIGEFTNRYATFLEMRNRARMPQVVAIIDEKSLLHIQRGDPFFRKLTNGLQDTLQRAGVSYGVYLQSDITAENFPLEAKLYLFLTPYRLTGVQRAAVKERLQKDGKTLAWLYAPGGCEERPAIGGAMEESVSGPVGITLQRQEWNSEVGSRITESSHPVTERLGGRELGVRERLNPSFYVDDPEATTLAEYQASGLPSMAVKNSGTWQSVFVGDPALPLELLRGICRYAGVHIWTPQGEDVVTVGNGWVTLHAARDGQRTIRLPEPTGLYDVHDGRLIADEASDYRFFLKMGATRTFLVGTTERFIELGLPNVSSLDTGRPAIVLNGQNERYSESRPQKPEPMILAVPVSAELNPHVETLKAVLTVDVSQLDNDLSEEFDFEDQDIVTDADPLEEGMDALSDAPGTDEELGANGRRRRRRGGRGRGRRHAGAFARNLESGGGTGPPSINEGPTSTPPPATSESSGFDEVTG